MLIIKLGYSYNIQSHFTTITFYLPIKSFKPNKILFMLTH